MTGTQVFDCLAERRDLTPVHGGNTPLAPDLTELCRRMVSSAFESGRMLRELRVKMFPTRDDAGEITLPKALQAEFQQWVHEADAVCQRAAKLDRAGHPIDKLAELKNLVGLAQAMLQITPEDHLRTIKAGSHGKKMSMEELRRELLVHHGR